MLIHPCSFIRYLRVHVITGSIIEVGDKQLEFQDGASVKSRRCLPPTPGKPILPEPPPKPDRHEVGLEPPSPGPMIQKTRPVS